MGGALFICYRRSDTGGHAGRLKDRLYYWFDGSQVFYDQATVDMGAEFPREAEEALTAARVVLVCIGKTWLEELKSRLQQTQRIDFTHAEVALALRLQAQAPARVPLIIPVLLDGAVMPRADELPEDIKGLAGIDALAFLGKDVDFDAQFQRLRARLGAVPGVPEPRFRLPEESAKRPFRLIDQRISPHWRDPAGHLDRLRQSLVQAGSAAIVARAALFGMGGLGKTQLALKYSREFCDAYDGVWWFRCEQAQTLELDARDCCLAAGVPLPDGVLPSAALRAWLEQASGRRWLLVYDNAEAPETLSAVLPEGRAHHVLITSRNPAWGTLASPVKLDAWRETHAAEFLQARLPEVEGKSLRLLAARLGSLPLALEQAAAFLEETRMPVREYLRLLNGEESAKDIFYAGRGKVTGYERSVLRTLSAAFIRLDAASRHLLRLCAYFGPEPIPERVFREGANILPAGLRAAVKEPRWSMVAGILQRYGLAERVEIPRLDAEAQEGEAELALRFHRLTQEVARHALGVSRQDGPAVQKLLRRALEPDVDEPENWPRYAAILPHVRAIEQFAASGWLDKESRAWLLDLAGRYLGLGPSLYTQSREMLALALRLDEQRLGKGHPDTFVSMGNLAWALCLEGNIAGARNMEERLVKVCTKVFGAKHKNTLQWMCNLAVTTADMGELEKARKLQEHVVEVREARLGREHPETLTAIGNLAVTLAALKDLPGAREREEWVLKIHLRDRGEKDPDTLTAMNNLAGTLMAMNELEAALKYEERVLRISRKLFRPEHPETLMAMNNLAVTMVKLGRIEEGRALQRQAVEGYLRVLGIDNADTLRAMYNLALSFVPVAEAAELLEKVCRGYRHLLGDTHPDTLNAGTLLNAFRPAAA